MNKDYYISTLEKQAAVANKALSFINKNKAAIIGGTGLASAGGLAYALGDDDAKAKVKQAGKSIWTGYMNGEAQDIGKNVGGLIGLGVAKAKGNSLGRAVTKGMIPGMAIADLAGAATIPTYQLYKKHKEEFGTAPDVKTTGKLLAANVLPTAGVWGGLYGAKKALRSGKLNPKAIPESANKISRGMTNLGNKMKRGTTRIANIDEALENRVGDVSKKIKNARRDIKTIHGNQELIDALGGFKGVNEVLRGHLSDTQKSVGKLGLAFAPLGLVQEAAALPTYVATPENLIEAKKNRIKQEQARG